MEKSDPVHPHALHNNDPKDEGKSHIDNRVMTPQKTESPNISKQDAPGDVWITPVHPEELPGSPQRQIDASANVPDFNSPTETTASTSNLKKISWQAWLIGLAFVVYLATRFIGLDAYPIYFFTDEAAQTVLAADLVRDSFHNYQGELLPTFLSNGGQYNLGLSVYAQILPYLVFGKSIWVTRGTSVLITLLAALAVVLMLKKLFKSNYAFAGILILCITPAWFLHSRTAFEVSIAVSFYAAFLYTYLQYRQGRVTFLYAAAVFGALCFYSYSPAQLVMAVTALALLISDLRTHIRNWKTLLIVFGIMGVLALPYFRFLIQHPDENRRHLEILNSYWIQAIPLTEKLGSYFKEYFKMLKPLYWFTANPPDLERHVMKGYGHLLRWTLPLYGLGLGVALRKAAKPEYRLILIATLAAPAGAALAGAAITRGLFMVIPAVMLTTIGLDQLMQWIEKINVPRLALIGLVFVGLSAFSGFMLGDALVNGPLWYSNYGLAGEQYGARQVFGDIKAIHQQNPSQRIFLSASWTNGTDVLARFFLDDPVPVELGSIDSYLFQKQDFPADQVFILIPEELDRAQASQKFKTITRIKTLDYPNGTHGFYYVNLDYIDKIDAVFAEEEAARRILNQSDVTDTQGRVFKVSYPQLDMGSIGDIFDGHNDTLIRTLETNPMRLEITPEKPFKISRVIIHIGGTPSTVTIRLAPADGSAVQEMVKEVPESNDFRDVIFLLDKPITMEQLSIDVFNLHDSDHAHVHLWEVSLQ